MNILNEILNTHDNLDEIIREPRGLAFVSEWNCSNPFANEYLNDIQNTNIPPEREVEYVYFKDDYYLSSMISKFHQNNNEPYIPTREQIVPGAGSTPLIAAFFLWLIKNNIHEFFYIPPMYYTFYYFSKLYSIHARPICSKQAFEENINLNLPITKSILILCDPIWYIGKCMNKDLINQIIEWQKITESIVFVDGSFQYTQWNLVHFEETSKLDPNLTFRIICPTKAIAIHGYRFSYALVPVETKEEYTYMYENICGSTPLRNLVFSHQAMKILLSNESNSKITNYIRNIYLKLKESSVLEPIVEPNSGYFIFAKLKCDKENTFLWIKNTLI